MPVTGAAAATDTALALTSSAGAITPGGALAPPWSPSTIHVPTVAPPLAKPGVGGRLPGTDVSMQQRDALLLVLLSKGVQLPLGSIIGIHQLLLQCRVCSSQPVHLDTQLVRRLQQRIPLPSDTAEVRKGGLRLGASHCQLLRQASQLLLVK